jgi:uncharacterized damage-inducible protein DinB
MPPLGVQFPEHEGAIPMPGTVRPVLDERDGLLAYLAQMRDALRFAVHGLTDEQASATPTTSTLSLAGLIKHVARVERHWIVEILSQRQIPPEAQAQGWADGFRLVGGETLADALDHYATVAAETESIIAEIDDLDRPVPVPRDRPWFPADVEAWSVRWVLLHLIQETARHAGHADIIREALDGTDAYRLMARAEGWEAEYERWQTWAAEQSA